MGGTILQAEGQVQAKAQNQGCELGVEQSGEGASSSPGSGQGL